VPLEEVPDALDGRPHVAVDRPDAAVSRRPPNLAEIEAAEFLGALNALELTKVPYIAGMVSSHAMADLSAWTTEAGWEMLGVGSAPTK
jgi:hypothetical protein